jgi:outer membrane protein TolC
MQPPPLGTNPKQRTGGAASARTRRALALALPLALLPSCMVGPDYQTPQARVEAQYVGNPAGSNQPVNIADAYWWKAFNDPVLNGLIETAYSNNLSLQVAGVRVLQARAQLNQSVGNLFPQQQGLSGALNYTKLDASSRARIPAGLTSDYFMDQVLFSASWEIDFWGKYRRTIQSDRAAFLGTGSRLRCCGR